MVIDKLTAILTDVRRRRVVAQSVTWSVVVVALAAPILAPGVFGHTVYLLGVLAVVVAAGLTDFLTTFAISAIAIVAVYLMDRRLGSSEADVLVRIGLFLALILLTTMGSEAFRRFQNQALSTMSELATSEAVMRTILETAPDAMLIIDTKGVVGRFSPAAEALFGWTTEEVVGRNVCMLMPAPYHGEHDGYINRYLETGERQIIGKSREVTGLRKNGTRFPMMLYVGEVKDGGERYFTGFIHDLTALHDANDRTNDLRAQLAHIWSMNSLGEMAAVLAHELNQPLAAIANYVRGARTMTARLELADDALLDALDKAGDQAIRAGEIIRRMRSLVTRSMIERKPESLAALISEVDFMASLVAREGGVSISYALADGPDEVMVDRIQIQQVTMNLVRNAVEAMQGVPKRELLISTARSINDWIVRIEDSGPGMTPETAERLFQPLQSDKAQGMGLGLSISRAIVEGHFGAIWVEDSLLGGAAFCFRLPVA